MFLSYILQLVPCTIYTSSSKSNISFVSDIFCGSILTFALMPRPAADLVFYYFWYKVWGLASLVMRLTYSRPTFTKKRLFVAFRRFLPAPLLSKWQDETSRVYFSCWWVKKTLYDTGMASNWQTMAKNCINAIGSHRDIILHYAITLYDKKKELHKFS